MLQGDLNFFPVVWCNSSSLHYMSEFGSAVDILFFFQICEEIDSLLPRYHVFISAKTNAVV